MFREQSRGCRLPEPFVDHVLECVQDPAPAIGKHGYNINVEGRPVDHLADDIGETRGPIQNEDPG